MVQYAYQVIEGDQHTPISIYLKLTGEKKFLLESSLKHEKSGRYSLIGVDPFYELIGTKNQVLLKDLINGSEEEQLINPLKALQSFVLKNIEPPIDLPFFSGGVGYVAYDTIKQFENIGEDAPDDIQMPDVHFMFYEKVIVYDHLMQQIHCLVFDRWITQEKINLEDELQQLIDQFHQDQTVSKESFTLTSFKSNISQKEYEQNVVKIKKHIKAGDIFQAVLSQRLSATYKGDPFAYYRQLRKNNPSPYMFYIDFNDYIVLGTSPESLIKVKDNVVMTNPIAGTRKRGLTDEEDQLLEKELLSDPKERAEHLMLVDLGRNDLGRICKPGSIHLNKYMVIERYRYVMHIVSEVTGTLKDHESTIQALISCLPAGTVSGAPKIRAMQIINETENIKRGVYSGAVGYLSINGNLDFALAIRTMVLKDQQAHVQAGAGIVYDSVPEQEYEETLNKAKALLEVT